MTKNFYPIWYLDEQAAKDIHLPGPAYAVARIPKDDLSGEYFAEGFLEEIAELPLLAAELYSLWLRHKGVIRPLDLNDCCGTRGASDPDFLYVEEEPGKFRAATVEEWAILRKAQNWR